MKIFCILKLVYLILSYTIIEFMKLFTLGITMFFKWKSQMVFLKKKQKIYNKTHKIIYINRINHALSIENDSVASCTQPQGYSSFPFFFGPQTLFYSKIMVNIISYIDVQMGKCFLKDQTKTKIQCINFPTLRLISRNNFDSCL